MSWDGFVDNIRQQCAVEKAAIIGVDGQIWGKSDNFSITGEECSKQKERPICLCPNAIPALL